MPWKKADPATAARFTAALPKHPDAQPKKMFGYPACFVNGHFFAGMHEGDTIVIRLPGELVQEFSVLAKATGFDPMRNGKGMKDWYVIPTAVTARESTLASLLADAFEHIRRLPPKSKAGRAPRKKASKTGSRNRRAGKTPRPR
mgnify:CR=1 FL=1